MSDGDLKAVEAPSTRPIGMIGGIGLTEVHVYAQHRAPDGEFSGCPHVHAVTDEAYFVLRGRGAVEFHDPANGYRRMPLNQGDYVHFPPLVMHRLVSDGELVVLGMMGAAGLAERGEARIYFGKDVDEDPKRFAELLTLPKHLGLEGALQRRDAAVSAYAHLMKLWNTDRAAYDAELRRFFDCHCRAMATLAPALREQVQRGPAAWATMVEDRIDFLPQGDYEQVPIVEVNHPGQDAALGMCGVLRPILTLQPWNPHKAII